MRSFLSVLTAASLLAAPVAQASQCARPTERAAFDVEGLKSQLMVTAITCQQQARYNAFIARYKRDLMSDEHAIDAYFHRAYGRSAQHQRDQYITLLANAQSDQGLKLGTLFCQKSVGMFDEVMALKDSSELPGYASGKALAQPIALVDCPPPKVRATRTAKR